MGVSHAPHRDHPPLSRRALLRTVGGMAAATFLAGCGRWSLPGFARPTPTREPQAIRLLARPELRFAFAIDTALENWQAAYADPIVLDDLNGDALSTVVSALAAGQPAWDGFAMIDAPWDTAAWVSRDLIQPLDDLILVSTVPKADQVIPALVPSARASSQYEGHQYLIPANISSITLSWFQEPLATAGVMPPQTWDEVRAAAEQIRAAAPAWTPFDIMSSPLCDLVSMIWGATATPLTADGLIDWTSEAAVAALRWKQEMVAADLMPAAPTRSLENWLNGDTAILSAADALGPIARQGFGMEAATSGGALRRERDVPQAGVPFWVHGSVVLRQAANPQGALDFFLWWFGPDNQAAGRQSALVAAKPAYQYTYDAFIAGDPDLQWQLDGLELVRNSVPFPANPYWPIQSRIAEAWIRRAVDPRSYIRAEDALESAWLEMREEIAALQG